jgi:CelD/BcsL family acetyltransferase involved in cellulose biosynthesis
MIEVNELRTTADLEPVRAEWDELARRVKASVFLSHGWFMACARNLSTTEKLKILLLRDGGRLVGIAPLMSSRTSLRRMPLDQVGFLINVLSPFCDFILEDVEKGIPAILSYLFGAGVFDVFNCSKLLESSPTAPVLQKELERMGIKGYPKQIAEVVYLPIAGPWDDFYNARSRKFRMTRRSVANKISRLGEISVHCASTSDELRPALQSLLQLSALGWKRKEKRDLLAEDAERNLLTALVEWGGGTGNVRIWLLKAANDVIAAEFHLVDGPTIYGIRAQYDPRHFSYSPGRALDYEIVERLFKEGFTRYDMGPGVAEYKRNWTDSSYSVLQVEAFPKRLYPQLVAQLHYKWVPALKQSRVGQSLTGRPEQPCPTDNTES